MPRLACVSRLAAMSALGALTAAPTLAQTTAASIQLPPVVVTAQKEPADPRNLHYTSKRDKTAKNCPVKDRKPCCLWEGAQQAPRGEYNDYPFREAVDQDLEGK